MFRILENSTAAANVIRKPGKSRAAHQRTGGGGILYRPIGHLRKHWWNRPHRELQPLGGRRSPVTRTPPPPPTARGKCEEAEGSGGPPERPCGSRGACPDSLAPSSRVARSERGSSFVSLFKTACGRRCGRCGFRGRRGGWWSGCGTNPGSVPAGSLPTRAPGGRA